MQNFKQHDLIYDVIIIGAGINGAGIARDLAGRGHSVYICDKGDVGAETSANSSKLIHGGLRYLEMYDFKLVKKSLKERERLTKIAPHLIQPMSFNLPHAPWLRSRCLIRLGLYLYDFLASSTLYKKSIAITKNDTHLAQLKESFTHGFKYQDGWVDDHRLVITNLKDSENNGAFIAPHSECISAKVSDGLWHASVKSKTGDVNIIKGEVLINAAGPWAQKFIETGIKKQSAQTLKLVKGSHIVLPKTFKQTESFILQNDDNRIIFTIPYLDNFIIIGTTEVETKNADDKIICSDEEVQYMCKIYNKYFKVEISEKDILWKYSGLRPLLQDDGKSARENTRDYKIETLKINEAPLMNIWGGKLTTYRALAEDAVKKLNDVYNVQGKNWTAEKTLPGGNITTVSAHAKQLKSMYPFIDESHALRLSKAYGDRAEILLHNKVSKNDLGMHFGNGLYACEVDYLLKHEWANTAEDILFRRTKLGLFLTPKQTETLNDYIQKKEA